MSQDPGRIPPAGADAGEVRLSDFDFDLPKELIALRPARPRDAARLLRVGDQGGFEDLRVRDLPGLVRPGDLLVFNDTRVVPARLLGVRRRGDLETAVAANLLRRLDPSRWTALMKPGKRLRAGDVIVFRRTVPEGAAAEGGAGVPEEGVRCRVEAKDVEGVVTLVFDEAGRALDLALERTGAPPLPPYIEALRPGDAADVADYQTVYARRDGSVAAPTAGLHFTPELLEGLKARGAECAFVTLHVGAGTFLPVKTEIVSEHRMHSEWGEISEATAERLRETRAAGGRVIAVGTTSLRLLEGAALRSGPGAPFCGEIDLFIRPGFSFQTTDLLLTNFHLPRSTLLILLAAFAGLGRVKAAYAHALAAGYRFYSYGDAGLWSRAPR